MGQGNSSTPEKRPKGQTLRGIGYDLGLLRLALLEHRVAMDADENPDWLEGSAGLVHRRDGPPPLGNTLAYLD
jgi:hypothetical protein